MPRGRSAPDAMCRLGTPTRSSRTVLGMSAFGTTVSALLRIAGAGSCSSTFNRSPPSTPARPMETAFKATRYLLHIDLQAAVPSVLFRPSNCCEGCYPAIPFRPTPPRETLMGGSESENRDELRARLRETSDLELRRFGRRARDLSNPKNNFGATDPHVIELDEARAEWRRRYPSQEAPSRSRISNLVAR